ncbi:PQQ-dependent sugar dehydrogenase [Luteolibacter pohnpeiensis]|uniref:PQQ-dependent sugar dehydrogenase n=1 Tax=Luteolibacter pohnpeiensis TaxID=454153 RepID=A0A934S7T0_9BACT|nr:PQQ-dependent sugar dehydrogenase [Luteolibacter pohnpeiensis]MBK1882794.1 PQQ-dependent sugar dehydrogenase [Luteolibacter pohnpeiensis]
MKALLALPFFLIGSTFAQQLQRQTLAEGLHDPMKLAIAPAGDIYIVEREGRVLRLNPDTGGLFKIGEIPVEALRQSNPDSDYAREDGLQSIALDPDFVHNQRVFIYYSPPDQIVDRLSRFTLKDGLLDLSSEKILIDIPLYRDHRVCHHGGCLTFGPDGLLYLSVGDNTNPFESDGSAPIDDREGHEFANAMRSAGNTNDLRGKILRIKPTEDGYEIPKGNLFPPGTDKTRPEIYVMGCRNPFRTSIDPKTDVLYWGEVGPDAGNDTPRGPRGYDEVNQAKSAGNYGWPFFVGNNKSYSYFDFSKNEPGPMTDPAAPVNPSRSNTGLKNLPPAHSAFIWYPYANSPEFPVVGSGGRNAMAGPVFYYDSTRKYNMLPKQDDHTLLTYDWIRGKIWKAELGNDESLKSLTAYADGFKLPIDLQMDRDGSLVMLEYGTEWWFNQNGRVFRLLPADADQAPTLSIAAGDDPLTFKVTEAKDPENEKIVVDWWLTTGTTEIKVGNGSSVTLPENHGGSEIRAVATDTAGNHTIARQSLIHEETLPQVGLEIAGHPQQLGFGEAFQFKLFGNFGDHQKQVEVRARYIPPTGHDAGGPQFSSEITKLIEAKACLACHQIDKTSTGPSYVHVALKYRGDTAAISHLTNKLKTGGSGVWGDVPMPPQLGANDEEIQELINAILHLGDGISAVSGVTEGKLVLSEKPENVSAGGAWEISASAPGFSSFRTRIPAK